MSRHGRRRKNQKLPPLPDCESRCLEHCHQLGNFRHHNLKKYADYNRGNHQFIFQMSHSEYGFSHIPHPHGMEKLGKPQNGKCIGLAMSQYSDIR